MSAKFTHHFRPCQPSQCAQPRPAGVSSVTCRREHINSATQKLPRTLQQASLSLAAALLMSSPALALDLPELPNPFAKSEAQQTREDVTAKSANLPSLTDSKNPTDFNQQKVPGLQAYSSKSSRDLSGIKPGKDEQGLGDVEKRKPGGELLSAGGAEFNPSGNR